MFVWGWTHWYLCIDRRRTRLTVVVAAVWVRLSGRCWLFSSFYSGCLPEPDHVCPDQSESTDKKNNYWLNCLIYRPHDHNITTLWLYNLRLSVSQPNADTELYCKIDTAHQLTAKFCPLRPTRNSNTVRHERRIYALLFILFIYFLTSEQYHIMITKMIHAKCLVPQTG